MQLLAQLNEHEVRYLFLWDFADESSDDQTVGNFGVWIEASHDNKTRFLSLLANMGYAPEDIQRLRFIDFFNPFAFTLELPSGLEVDIMTAPEDCSPEDFDAYYGRSTPVKWEDITFHMVEWASLARTHEAFSGQISTSALVIKLRKDR